MIKTGQKPLVHNPLEVQMLTALELFHYAYRFRGHLFVLSFDPDVDFEETITDLRVLESTYINVVLVLPYTETLREKLEAWNSRGSRYVCFDVEAGSVDIAGLELQLRNALSLNQMPVISVKMDNCDNDSEHIVQDQLSFELSGKLNVDKLFFLTSKSGLQVRNKFYSHPTPDEIEIILKNPATINIGVNRLEAICSERKKYGFEVVLLGCESGALFEEIFTHRGRGTLLSDRYPNLIRRGSPADAKEIALLIKAHVAEEVILPISEDEIYSQIENFFVYTVNGAIVACAKLSDYGEWAEVAKFCTLPRYQRKGRAHELAKAMIDTAREDGKAGIFALSVVPKMWEFFKNLGFREIDRDSLPSEWKARYDFSRPSRAFRLEFNS